MLERGGYLPREKDNWSSKTVFIDNKYKAKETWRDKDGGTFHPGIHYNVGGNSKVYGAALLRMRAQDFGEVKHHGGISPEWPIRYNDLESYYTQAEHLYHVHGNLVRTQPNQRPARPTSIQLLRTNPESKSYTTTGRSAATSPSTCRSA